MNKARRAQLSEIETELRTIFDQVDGKLDDARFRLETLKDEEQEYYDNMPESLQNGEKGERASQAVSEMENAISELDGLAEKIREAADNVSSAASE